MKKKYLIVSLLIFISVLSCNFIDETTNNAGLTGNTTLDLPISYNLSSVSRTLATDYGITVSSVTVTVGNDLFTYGPEVLTFDDTTDVASGTIEDIVEGTYTVTLSAYMLDNDSNPVLVAEGMQTDVSIISDQTTSVDISMSIVVGIGDLVVNGSIILNEIPRDGLVAEFLFDGDASDTSILENNGSDVGGPTYIEGKVGQALSVNGTGDYVEVPNNSAYYFQDSSYTISIWVKIREWNESWGGWIISTIYSSDNTQGWFLYFRNNLMTFNDRVNPSITNESPINLDTWTHVLIVGDISDNTQSMYINGVYESGSEYISLTPSTYPLVFGYHYGFADREINGEIDQVRFYDRVLTESEIAVLYNE